MRVTNRMMTENLLTNLNRNLEALERTQAQMSSGLAVTKPSDDPVALAQIMSFKTILAEQDQHIRNMTDGIGWIDVSESALNGATQVLQRARELAVYGADGAMDQGSRVSLAEEVDQLINELVQVANSSYGGRYTFGGSETTTLPFERVGDTVFYRGNDRPMEWEIAPKVTMAVNADGATVFDAATDQPSMLFQSLFELRDQLSNGDTEGLSNSSIDNMDRHIDNVLAQRAILGAKSKRLEMGKDRADLAGTKLKEILGNLEEVDLPQAAMFYKSQEVAYQAALSVGAQIIQLSLADFLR